MVTTFDLKRREIRRRNLFGGTRTFRFSDIAAVVPAADEKGRWFYTMLPKRNLYGPGLPLTGRYRWSPLLAYLSEYLIPAVSTALFGCSDGTPLLESEEEALQGKPPAQPKKKSVTGKFIPTAAPGRRRPLSPSQRCFSC